MSRPKRTIWNEFWFTNRLDIGRGHRIFVTMTYIHSAFCALFECNLSTVCIYLTARPSGLSGHHASCYYTKCCGFKIHMGQYIMRSTNCFLSLGVVRVHIMCVVPLWHRMCFPKAGVVFVVEEKLTYKYKHTAEKHFSSMFIIVQALSNLGSGGNVWDVCRVIVIINNTGFILYLFYAWPCQNDFTLPHGKHKQNPRVRPLDTGSTRTVFIKTLRVWSF